MDTKPSFGLRPKDGAKRSKIQTKIGSPKLYAGEMIWPAKGGTASLSGARQSSIGLIPQLQTNKNEKNDTSFWIPTQFVSTG